MDIYNYTDFPALSFRQIQAGTGTSMACLTVKATCDLIHNQPLVFSDQQVPILYEDEYLGDPHATPMIAVGDLIPFKPSADITMVANAPVGAIHHAETVSLKVGKASHEMRVVPLQRSSKDGDLWRSQYFATSESLPLSWAKAYGGVLSYHGDPPYDVVRENPLGCGALDIETAPEDIVVDHPQILPPASIGNDQQPWGCAPVPAWWRWRQKFAGTYDDAWLSEIHPRLPDDFDYRFYQVAPPQLILDGYLQAGDPIVLQNVVADILSFSSRLPVWAPRVSVSLKSNEVFSLPLNLDGCHFDLCGPNASVVLTWRSWVADASNVQAFKIETDGLDALLRERYEMANYARINTWPKWVL